MNELLYKPLPHNYSANNNYSKKDVADIKIKLMALVLTAAVLKDFKNINCFLWLTLRKKICLLFFQYSCFIFQIFFSTVWEMKDYWSLTWNIRRNLTLFYYFWILMLMVESIKLWTLPHSVITFHYLNFYTWSYQLIKWKVKCLIIIFLCSRNKLEHLTFEKFTVSVIYLFIFAVQHKISY